MGGASLVSHKTGYLYDVALHFILQDLQSLHARAKVLVSSSLSWDKLRW